MQLQTATDAATDAAIDTDTEIQLEMLEMQLP